jgi:signal peptidase I
VYRHGETEITVNIVPAQPAPDSLGFEDFHLYKTIRIFIVGRAELNGVIPKEGDTITYNNTIYTVKKTPNTPCYENIGNYEVMLRIYTSIYRSP